MLLYRLFRLKKYGELLPEPKRESPEAESPVMEAEPLEEEPKAVITVTREKKQRKRREQNAALRQARNVWGGKVTIGDGVAFWIILIFIIFIILALGEK